jgi:hypothetical protein
MRWIPAAGIASLLLVIGGCQDPTGGTSPSGNPSPPTAKQWVMPNLVGVNLQQAQDRIQALTGDPLFLTTSHDASGKGRHQILDRDWKVCAQNVPPGASITMNSKIDFGTVKLAESCP